MSKTMKKLAFILTVLFLCTKCASVKNSTPQLTVVASPCEYEFDNISDIRVDDILFNDKNSVALALLPKVNSLLSNVSDTTMLEYSINLKLKNLTADTLCLKQFRYTLYVDKKIMDLGVIEDSITISPYHIEKYSLLIQSKVADYRKVFKDSKESANILKGLLGLNNQVVNSSLEITGIVYEVNEKELIDDNVKKIKF